MTYYNKKKESLKKLFAKKIFRTIKSQPWQFIAMAIIIALGVSLFNGLFASYSSFNKQRNEYINNSNAYDIQTILSYKNDEEGEQKHKEDEETLSNVIGNEGYVEGNYYSNVGINSFTGFISLSETYPTINHPYNFTHGVKKENNFFYITNKYLTNPTLYGDNSNWLNKDGSLKPLRFVINIANFKNSLSEEDLNILEDCSLNDFIFKDDTMVVDATPTATISYADDILPGEALPFTCLMDRIYLENLLKEKFIQSFDTGKLTREKPQLAEIITNPKDHIINKYYYNNRYFTKLNNHNRAFEYCHLIENNNNKFTGSIVTNLDLERSPTYIQLSADAEQILKLTLVIPPIFFIVALLIMISTFSQILIKERQEIGILKSLGVGNRQIVIYYAVFASLVGLIGIIIGSCVGPFLLPPLFNIKNKILYDLPKFHYVYPTLTICVSSLIIISVIWLVIYLITRKITRVKPSEIIRDIENKNTAHTKNLSNKKISTNKLCRSMAIRNIFSAKLRSVMVIIGIFGCTALLGCGFGVDNSVQKGVENDTNIFFNTDGQVYFSDPNQNTLDALNDMHNKDIIDFEFFGHLPATYNTTVNIDQTATTSVYLLDTLNEPEYKFFNLPKLPNENNIVITNKVAKNLNLRINDPVIFTVLGKKYSGYVSDIVDAFYYHGIFIDSRFSDYPHLDQNATNCNIRISKGQDKNKVINDIKSLNGVANVLDKEKLRSFINDTVSSLSYITTTIKVFAIILAIVVVYNLGLLNFIENIRNIATMKVLGFNRREIALSLLYEIGILTAIGTVLGLLIAYPFTSLVLSITKVPTCEFIIYLAPISFLFIFLLSFGASLLVNIYLSFKNNRVNMVESLKQID